VLLLHFGLDCRGFDRVGQTLVLGSGSVLVGAILFTFSSLIRDFQDRVFGSSGHQGCLVAPHDNFVFLFVRTDGFVLGRKEERLLANVHPSCDLHRPIRLRLEK
jgi:hypothetical protein